MFSVARDVLEFVVLHQIIRNGKGEIIALYPLMPNRMTVDRDDKGQLYYQYNTSKDDAPTMKGSMVNLKPSYEAALWYTAEQGRYNNNRAEYTY